MEAWTDNWTADLWQTALAEGLGEAEIKAPLADATHNGRPLGGQAFVDSCQTASEICLCQRKPGPKPARNKQRLPKLLNFPNLNSGIVVTVTELTEL